MRKFLSVLAVILFIALACAASSNGKSAQAFSFVVLPDTQFEVTHDSKSTLTPEIDWIVSHQKQYNIKFVIGEGDIINTSTYSEEWQNASQAFSILEAHHIPYILAAGNHDVYDYVPKVNMWYNPPGKLVDKYFPISRYKKFNYQTYSMNGSSVDSYQLFNVEEIKFLALTVPFGPTDDELVWANSVAAKYPDRHIIFTTHDYVGDAGQIRTVKSVAAAGWGEPMPGANAPDQIQKKFVSKFSNINYVVSGHIVAFEKSVNGVPKRTIGDSCFQASRLAGDGNHCFLTATNVERHTDGKNTYAMVFNAQVRPDGGGDYLRMLTVDPNKHSTHVQTINGNTDYFVRYPTGIQGNDFTLPFN